MKFLSEYLTMLKRRKMLKADRRELLQSIVEREVLREENERLKNLVEEQRAEILRLSQIARY